MASPKGVPTTGSGAGPDKKRTAPASAEPEQKHEHGAGAAPKATPATASEPAPKADVAHGEDLVVVTMKANTGSIVSIEVAGPDGARHKLSPSETAQLAGERPTFASLVHDAFEAGIACILDDGDGDDVSAESEEDVDLHDALLDALIERSAAKRLLSRETVASAVLGTIIREALNGGKAAAPPG
jgi:hypothetical protein